LIADATLLDSKANEFFFWLLRLALTMGSQGEAELQLRHFLFGNTVSSAPKEFDAACFSFASLRAQVTFGTSIFCYPVTPTPKKGHCCPCPKPL
jgi:hypothetical protein